MCVDPVFELTEEDRKLGVGQRVTANWTALGFVYRVPAEVVALDMTTVTVRLLERAGNLGEIPAGRELVLPRMSDAARWSSENCVRLKAGIGAR